MLPNVHDKNTQQTRNGRGLPEPDKGHPSKPMTSALMVKHWMPFASMVRTNTRMSALTKTIQRCSGESRQGNWRRKTTQWGKNSLFNRWLGQLDFHIQNKTGLLPHTVYKNKLKMYQRPKWKSYNYKTLGREHRSKSLCPWISQWFLDTIPKAQATKKKQLNWTSSKLRTFMLQGLLSKGKGNPQYESKY